MSSECQGKEQDPAQGGKQSPALPVASPQQCEQGPRAGDQCSGSPISAKHASQSAGFVDKLTPCRVWLRCGDRKSEPLRIGVDERDEGSVDALGEALFKALTGPQTASPNASGAAPFREFLSTHSDRLDSVVLYAQCTVAPPSGQPLGADSCGDPAMERSTALTEAAVLVGTNAFQGTRDQAVGALDAWLNEHLPTTATVSRPGRGGWRVLVDKIDKHLMAVEVDDEGLSWALYYADYPITLTRPSTQIPFTEAAVKAWCELLAASPELIVKKPALDPLLPGFSAPVGCRPYKVVESHAVVGQQNLQPEKRRVYFVAGETGIGKTMYATTILPSQLYPDVLYATMAKTQAVLRPDLENRAKKLDDIDKRFSAALEAESTVRKLKMLKPRGRTAADQGCAGAVISAAVRKAALSDKDLCQLYGDRRLEAEEMTKLLFKDAIDAHIGTEAHSAWKAAAGDERPSVMFIIDEIGKCMPLARGLISAHDTIHKALAKLGGFAHVELVLCGCGTDAFNQPSGPLRVSSDPPCCSVIRLVSNKPDSDEATRFREALLGFVGVAAPPADELSSRAAATVRSLWTNARIAALLAKQLLLCVGRNGTLRWTEEFEPGIVEAGRIALKEFYNANGLSKLSEAQRRLCANVVLAVLSTQAARLAREQAATDTGGSFGWLADRDDFCDGVWFDPSETDPFPYLAADPTPRYLNEGEMIWVLEECHILGLVTKPKEQPNSGPPIYQASAAIECAVCVDFGRLVLPRDGPSFQHHACLVLRRRCEVEGYRASIVALSEPLPYAVGSGVAGLKATEAARIVEQLRPIQPEESRERAATGWNAVVLQNGPSAFGADCIVLRVDHRHRTASITLVGLKNKRDTGGWKEKYSLVCPDWTGCSDTSADRALRIAHASTFWVVRALKWLIHAALMPEGTTESLPEKLTLADPKLGDVSVTQDCILWETRSLVRYSTPPTQSASINNAISFKEHLGLFGAWMTDDDNDRQHVLMIPETRTVAAAPEPSRSADPASFGPLMLVPISLLRRRLQKRPREDVTNAASPPPAQ